MKSRLKYAWDNLERYGMIALFIAFYVNVFLQVVMRVIFNSPFTFTEEVSRYCFVWMVFLGLSFATRYDCHVRVDVFVKLLPKTVQFVIEILIMFLTLAIFAWTFWVGIQYIGYSSITNIYTLPINKGIVVAILPISAVLMIIRSIEKIIRDTKRFIGISRKE